MVGVDIPKTMDVDTLKEKLDRVKRLMAAKNLRLDQLETDDRLDYLNFGVEYWKRFALASSCVIFALMGVAFGVIRTRTVRSNSFLICLVVLLLYWTIYSYGFSLASEGKVHAIVGTFAANLLMLGIALYTLRKVAR